MEKIKKAYNELAKAVNFKCLGCGKCGCLSSFFDANHTLLNNTIILLMDEEVEILKKKDKMYGIVSKSNGNINYLKRTPERCVFFNKKNKCDIHKYKPIICLLHPFQVFMTGFVFSGGLVFDTKCSWVKKHRKKLDNPTKKVLEAYNKLYSLVMEYKIKIKREYKL